MSKRTKSAESPPASKRNKLAESPLEVTPSRTVKLKVPSTLGEQFQLLDCGFSQSETSSPKKLKATQRWIQNNHWKHTLGAICSKVKLRGWQSVEVKGRSRVSVIHEIKQMIKLQNEALDVDEIVNTEVEVAAILSNPESVPFETAKARTSTISKDGCMRTVVYNEPVHLERAVIIVPRDLSFGEGEDVTCSIDKQMFTLSMESRCTDENGTYISYLCPDASRHLSGNVIEVTFPAGLQARDARIFAVVPVSKLPLSKVVDETYGAKAQVGRVPALDDVDMLCKIALANADAHLHFATNEKDSEIVLDGVIARVGCRYLIPMPQAPMPSSFQAYYSTYSTTTPAHILVKPPTLANFAQPAAAFWAVPPPMPAAPSFFGNQLPKMKPRPVLSTSISKGVNTLHEHGRAQKTEARGSQSTWPAIERFVYNGQWINGEDGNQPLYHRTTEWWRASPPAA